MSAVSNHEGAGHDDSFDAFFRAQYPKTVRLARLLTGADAWAEDVAQEAFARIHRHYPG